MTFQNPWIFILLPVALLLLFSMKGERRPSLRFSTESLLNRSRPTLTLRMSKGIIFLRLLAVILIIIALARPQLMLQESRIETEGIDIILAVDTSTSMLAEDFELGGRRENRLEVVRDVIKDFISHRHSDRIGIVAFAAAAYTVAPLTLDYGWLMQNLERVKIGMIEDGTAIGSGLSSALNRLKDSGAKGKVVILLTDGRNNAGKISPLTAADAARALNIKVYTIGAGSKGLVPYPAKDVFGNTVYRQVQIDIDEETLKKIAEKTKGRYYRATDTKSLRNIYEEIDKIEKTPIEEKGYTEFKELFHLFLIPALVLLLLEVILKNTVLRRIP